MALPNGTVGMFLVVLRSELTKWDAKYNRSPYGLGLMLEAAQAVEEEVTDVLDSADPTDLRRLAASIEDHFTKMRWRDSVLRQIEKYIATGKLPTLLGKVRGRGQMGF